jgi:ABC-type transporter Mla subunit MlaD
VFVSAGTKVQASGTLDGARRLYAARLDVAAAEEALGGSDLEDALKSAKEANATAARVRSVTTEIADLLASAEQAATATSETSEEAVRTVSLTRRQTSATADLLALIAGYQTSATRFADDTNRALQRILRALRKTNESFPGGGG